MSGFMLLEYGNIFGIGVGKLGGYEVYGFLYLLKMVFFSFVFIDFIGFLYIGFLLF